jgi:ribose 5-phosphate isomerase A
VLTSLRSLGSPSPQVRSGVLAKAGPLKTDQDFFIIDAPFSSLLTASDVAAGKGKGDGEGGLWEVNKLSAKIKAITGVLEVGLFSGYDGLEAKAAGLATGGQKPVTVYFGMEDGGVEVRIKNRQGKDKN